MDKLLRNWSLSTQEKIMYIFALIILSSIFGAIRYQINFLALLPFGAIIGYLCIVDFRKVFFLLLICLPFSIEAELPGGFATDLPTEPLVLILMGVSILYFFKNISSTRGDFFSHPVTFFLGIHFTWIFICIFTSADTFVSTKFFLAKFWYIVVYFFLSGFILREENALRTMIWCISIPIAITTIYVIIRHAGYAFAFDKINSSVGPFYRNHVNYAATLSLFTPFIWYLKSTYERNSLRWKVLWGILVIIIIGIIFHFRLIKIVLMAALIGSILFTSNLLTNNKYLEYAPNFEKTIAHKEFDNLVAATAKGEDVSVMERFYRWIAGVYMVKERAVFGFGPGNFHGFYKAYTVRSFETYVSDNPEKSGIHCYYLMLGVEQGIPGIIFFLALLFYFFYRLEIVYHRETNPTLAGILMATYMCVIVIVLLLIINDLIETDKVGSFFFICLAILVNIDLQQKRKINNTDSFSKLSD